MKRHASKLLKTAAAFAAPLLIGSAAQAAPILDLISSYAPPQQLSDENREILIDRVGQNNILDIGDSIRGYAAFDQLIQFGNATIGLGGQNPNPELTAVFQIMVTGKKALASPGQFQFTFGPDPAFVAEILAHTGSVAPGVMAVLFEDPTNNVNLNSSVAVADATSIDGTPFWYLGFEDPAGAAHFDPITNLLVTTSGEGWVGEGQDDLNNIIPGGNSFGKSNFGINRVSPAGTGGTIDLIKQPGALNEFGQPPVATLADFIGKADNVGPSYPEGVTPPFPLWSDTRLTFQVAVIPLPAAVWGGLGLMGLMGVRRVRKANRE